MPTLDQHLGKFTKLMLSPKGLALSETDQQELKRRYYARILVKDPGIRATMQKAPDLAATMQRSFLGEEPEPSIYGEERVGPLIEHTRMLDYRAIPGGLSKIRKSLTPDAPRPALETITETVPTKLTQFIRGGTEAVATPLITYGLSKHPVQTTAALGVFGGMHYGLEKGRQALEEQGIKVHGPSFELGQELLKLGLGSKAFEALRGQFPSVKRAA